jgi:hypothetical protein
MNNKVLLGIALVGVGLAGLLFTNIIVLGNVNLVDATTIVAKYTSTINNPDLAAKEIVEFELNYYVVFYEKSTEMNAFEMLIDKQSGRMFPEYGPNMMWNTKYGHMGMMRGIGGMMVGGMMGRGMMVGGMSGSVQIQGEPQITLDKANEIAQKYIDSTYSGANIEDVLQFYGYYTVHIETDGKFLGMFSVNAYTGSVWWHSWHGAYIQSRDLG